MLTRHLRDLQRRAQPGREPARPVARGRLVGADRLHLPRRQRGSRTRFWSPAPPPPRCFPFIGTIVYAILRPPEFLEDAHERELEIKAAELRVRQLTEQSCPNCEYPVEKNSCAARTASAALKDPCPTCGKPVDPRWALCPYCETRAARPRRASSRAAGARSARQQQPRRRGAAEQARRRTRRRAQQRPRRKEQSRRRSRKTEPTPPRAAARQGAATAVAPPRSRRGAGPRQAPSERRSRDVPDPDPGQARRLRARPHRRGDRPLRAQGSADRRAEADAPPTRRSPTQHYAEHAEKPFFGELVEFITGGPLVADGARGSRGRPGRAPADRRDQPGRGAPGSIRGDFALEVTFNMVHGSDSDESAEREIGIWFPSC